jgi:hypothetical protein
VSITLIIWITENYKIFITVKSLNRVVFQEILNILEKSINRLLYNAVWLYNQAIDSKMSRDFYTTRLVLDSFLKKYFIKHLFN